MTTNNTQELDEILDSVLIGMYCTDPDGSFVPLDDSKNVLRNEAKQAITSLIKELVAEAKPNNFSNAAMTADETNWYGAGYNHALEKFEQNLLKALEEV